MTKGDNRFESSQISSDTLLHLSEAGTFSLMFQSFLRMAEYLAPDPR